MLHLAVELNCIKNDEYEKFMDLSINISKMTAGLIKKL